ncbi:Os10g0404700 [Oryza sativa Japonica Group]|uniref:Os10g0404700 protein n=1 Tax=Oryza sativa subsp. japonica TaxID=39947 RepID=A0A0P0XU15_ORYSJ|nr:Os10g0404700 [Oryza sativa Japonica Group]
MPMPMEHCRLAPSNPVSAAPDDLPAVATICATRFALSARSRGLRRGRRGGTTCRRKTGGARLSGAGAGKR